MLISSPLWSVSGTKGFEHSRQVLYYWVTSTADFFSLGCLARSETAERYHSSLFSFLRSFYTLQHNDCANIHSDHHHMRPISTFLAAFVCLLFVLDYIQLHSNWDELSVVLIHNFLMGSDIKLLFHILFGHWISSFDKCLFKSLAQL